MRGLEARHPCLAKRRHLRQRYVTRGVSDAEQAEIDTMQDKAIQAIVDTYEVRRAL